MKTFPQMPDQVSNLCDDVFVYVIAAEIANTPETKVTPIGRSAAHAKMGLGGNLTDLVNKLRELRVATSSVIIWTAPV